MSAAWLGSPGSFVAPMLLPTATRTLPAVFATQTLNKPKLTAWYLRATIACGFGFLVVKTFEWGAKFEHGLYPRAAVLDARPHGEILYFGLYFTMTGLHALHVIIGMVILSFVLAWVSRNKITQQRSAILENGVLYWHLVDLIWIFLFPLFYLIS